MVVPEIDRHYRRRDSEPDVDGIGERTLLPQDQAVVGSKPDDLVAGIRCGIPGFGLVRELQRRRQRDDPCVLTRVLLRGKKVDGLVVEALDLVVGEPIPRPAALPSRRPGVLPDDPVGPLFEVARPRDRLDRLRVGEPDGLDDLEGVVLSESVGRRDVATAAHPGRPDQHRHTEVHADLLARELVEQTLPSPDFLAGQVFLDGLFDVGGQRHRHQQVLPMSLGLGRLPLSLLLDELAAIFRIAQHVGRER